MCGFSTTGTGSGSSMRLTSRESDGGDDKADRLCRRAASQKPSASSCWTSRRRLAPEGGPHGKLATPHRAASNQQARDVRARDRQHQPGDHQQHGEEHRNRFELLGRAIQRRELAQAGGPFAWARGQPPDGRGKGGPALFEPLAGAEAIPPVARRRSTDPSRSGISDLLSGQIELGHDAKSWHRPEVRRQHADDGVRVAVDQHHATQHVAGAAQPPAPETVADDRHAWRRARRRPRSAEKPRPSANGTSSISK